MGAPEGTITLTQIRIRDARRKRVTGGPGGGVKFILRIKDKVTARQFKKGALSQVSFKGNLPHDLQEEMETIADDKEN